MEFGGARCVFVSEKGTSPPLRAGAPLLSLSRRTAAEPPGRCQDPIWPLRVMAGVYAKPTTGPEFQKSSPRATSTTPGETLRRRSLSFMQLTGGAHVRRRQRVGSARRGVLYGHQGAHYHSNTAGL